MPRFVDSNKPRAGPGSAIRVRGRSMSTKTVTLTSSSFIKDDDPIENSSPSSDKSPSTNAKTGEVTANTRTANIIVRSGNEDRKIRKAPKSSRKAPISASLRAVGKTSQTGTVQVDRTKATKLSKQPSVQNRQQSQQDTTPRKENTTSSPNNKSKTHNPADSILARKPSRGIAVDNRVLQTVEGDAVGKMFLTKVEQFLVDCEKRGVAPSDISLFHNSNDVEATNTKNIKEGRVRVKRQPKIEASQFCPESVGVLNISPVYIREPVNASNVKNRSCVHVPKNMLANDSWRLFGDLADKISYAQNNRNLDIKVLTNDVALFTDANNDSHKRGIGRFFDRLQTLKNPSTQSVEIIVIETGTVAMPNEPIQVEGSAKTTQDSTPQTVKVVECVRAIQSKIEALYASSIKKGTDIMVDLRITTLQNHPLVYQEMLRKWIRNDLKPTSTSNEPVCLHFDLPETMDGTQCSVSLDLSYTIMPVRMDSDTGRGMQMDLQLLLQSRVQTLQLIPVSSIDASLLFGVPMSAKAGMESDLMRYRDMQILVRQLWKYLAKRDLALVLKCCSPANVAGESGKPPYTIYHASHQYLLLMAEEVVSCDDDDDGLNPAVAKLHIDKGRKGLAPAHGMVYRMATGNQLLRDVAEETADFGEEEVCEDQPLSGTSEQYYSFVENSLEFLDRGGFNPLIHATEPQSLDRTVGKPRSKQNDPEVSDSDGRWSDGSGVSSDKKVESPSNEEPDGKDILLEDSDDMLDAFEY